MNAEIMRLAGGMDSKEFFSFFLLPWFIEMTVL